MELKALEGQPAVISVEVKVKCAEVKRALSDMTKAFKELDKLC